MKLTNVVKDGKIPPKENKLVKPWEVLSVDLCGPWKIKCIFEEAEKDAKQQTRAAIIWVLTMIDEGSGWPEITSIQNKQSEEIARLVDNVWFSRYPRPLCCIHDNGRGFIGEGFVEMLESYGVDSNPTTIKNSQSNGIQERMHLVLCEMLRTQHLIVPKGSTAAREINSILQSTAWAMRTSTNLITKYSPAQLVFERDMIFHKKTLTDWDQVHARRRAQQMRDNARENKSRTDYKYKKVIE